ncbi:MAG: efflux transporter outer membrane subunit [Gammaproteobacteria bacterium]
MRKFATLITFLSAALTGCMVGPNFHSPNAPNTNHYTEAPQPKKTTSIPSVGSAGKVQHFIMGRDIPAEWWALFHSPEINGLVVAGLENSPTLDAAEAALRVSQEAVIAQIGTSLFPSISTQISGQRQANSNASFTGASSQNLFNLYNASVNVSYTLDVFGGARREIESLRDQVDYQQFQVEAAYLTLTSNIVTTSITLASLQAQIQATHELIQAQTRVLTILKQQFRYGAVSEANVLTQETTLAQTRATLPPLEQSQSQSRHSLSVLIGEFPSESAIPKIQLAKLNLPANLPVSLPSVLVRQRPDIRASEALLAAASAQIGVATANLFPQITLNGSFGWLSPSTGNLFDPASKVWSFGGQILQPIFNGGALLSKRRGAMDAFDQAYAQYRQTVLQAFQNVADTLRALEHDAQTLKAQRQAEVAARRSLTLTTEQYHLGGVDYLNLLTAELQYEQTKIARIQAQAARYTDTAALFQALGGGWWNRGMATCLADTTRNAKTCIWKG